jgi:uncharacterized membrane protein
MDHEVTFLISTCLLIYILFKVRSISRRLRGFDPAAMASEIRALKVLIRSMDAVSRTPPPEPAAEPARHTIIPPASKEAGKSVAPSLPSAPRIAVTPVSVPDAPAQPPQVAASEPTPPRPPSKFAQTVQDILTRTWQWILVGEEFRPKGVTMEYAVATTWLMRAGVVALVACAAFFLKWTVDKDLLGPPMRVGLSTLFGLAMLGGGLRLLGKHLNILGQGLVGGGIATLYFSVYALGPWYHLVDSHTTVFALMVLITVAAGVLAIFTNSMLVAIFGIIGGFCTPVLLRTGVPHLVALYGYLLLLNLGVLGIAHVRQWRLLNYLGFVLTYAYVVFLGFSVACPAGDFALVLMLLSLLFAAQSTLVFIYNIRQRRPATVLEIVHLVLNAALYSGCAYKLVVDAHGRPWPALVALGLALYYVVHVVLFLRSRLTDRPLLVALISLAGFFTTMAMPLAIEKESLTIAWALQAFMFLWIGRSLDSNFLRHTAYAVYAIVLWRLLACEMPRFDTGIGPGQEAAYWKGIAGRLWTFGVSIGSILGAYLLERRRPGTGERSETMRQSDTPDLAPSSAMRHVFFWCVAVCLFLYLNFELYSMFAFFAPWRPSALTVLWCATATFFLILYLESGAAVFLASVVFLAMAAAGKTLFWDAVNWNICWQFYFDAPYGFLPFLARWMGLASVLALLLGAWFMTTQRRPTPFVPQVFGCLTLFLLWLYASVELRSLLHWRLREFQAGGVSVLWTVFAFAFLAGGIWKNVRPVRYAGLALFTVVVGKVFLFDLSHMPAIYRVLAFMVLGVLLLLGAYAYLRASRRFASEK